MQNEDSVKQIPYRHHLFAPGTRVYVSEGIRALHEEHQLAGLEGEAVESFYLQSADPQLQQALDQRYAVRHWSREVPIRHPRTGKVYLVEDEYVFFA